MASESTQQQINIQITDDEFDVLIEKVEANSPPNPRGTADYCRTIRNMASSHGVFFDYRIKYQIDLDSLTSCIRLKEIP